MQKLPLYLPNAFKASPPPLPAMFLIAILISFMFLYKSAFPFWQPHCLTLS